MGKYKDKNVGFIKGFKPGATKRKPVIDERDGSVGDHHIEHYDGSQDAVVNMKSVDVRSRVQEDQR